ncbi:hypothetical protein BT63DRAFT_449774 [Microthyrium microscopicum]|uniref:DUF676 domain-containing protein n=1 Tax=Microthyrium microscopicum TaxID=703497 RepID=A0A6A6USN3_9PEZI|nr:hypothetical protein BT63DRAFT_449774 [Microthyrium microscopicum]
MTVSFLPSQLATLSQTPLPYTSNPRQLLLSDLLLALSKAAFIPGIILPWRFGSDASPWDELYPSLVNIKSIILHIILVVAQTAFLISLPFFIVFPAFWVVGYVALFLLFNAAVCKLLNGNQLTLEPSAKVMEKINSRGYPNNDHEYWIFMNGVAVGKDWLQSNIDRLSLTFGRKVHGVHNPTDGIIFDLIQCLVQRNFTYATNDIREAYVSIKKALYEENVTKVVFILHSQGGIEGAQIIDWLLDEVPNDNMRRLEVYTFGNAANHFNNPQRQSADKPNPLAKQTPVIPLPRTRKALKAIGHIEHYANHGDFVSEIGVLNYANGSTAVRNRFMGRLFASGQAGHLLNQHYLHQMFPLESEYGKCKNSNEFMDAVVVDRDGSDEGRDDIVDSVVGNGEVTFVGDVDSPISPQSFSPMGSVVLDKSETALLPKPVVKVKNLSRLWLYRNGGSPPDYIKRAATT